MGSDTDQAAGAKPDPAIKESAAAKFGRGAHMRDPGGRRRNLEARKRNFEKLAPLRREAEKRGLLSRCPECGTSRLVLIDRTYEPLATLFDSKPGDEFESYDVNPQWGPWPRDLLEDCGSFFACANERCPVVLILRDAWNGGKLEVIFRRKRYGRPRKALANVGTRIQDLPEARRRSYFETMSRIFNGTW